MTFGYVLRPQADLDIDNISDYLVEHAGLDTGLQFLSDIYETFATLTLHPEMGWPCKVRNLQITNARVFRVSARFEKYLIFYQLIQGRIEILRVLHGAQDLAALFGREGIG